MGLWSACYAMLLNVSHKNRHIYVVYSFISGKWRKGTYQRLPPFLRSTVAKYVPQKIFLEAYILPAHLSGIHGGKCMNCSCGQRQRLEWWMVKEGLVHFVPNGKVLCIEQRYGRLNRKSCSRKRNGTVICIYATESMEIVTPNETFICVKIEVLLLNLIA